MKKGFQKQYNEAKSQSKIQKDNILGVSNL